MFRVGDDDDAIGDGDDGLHLLEGAVGAEDHGEGGAGGVYLRGVSAVWTLLAVCEG